MMCISKDVSVVGCWLMNYCLWNRPPTSDLRRIVFLRAGFVSLVGIFYVFRFVGLVDCNDATPKMILKCREGLI